VELTLLVGSYAQDWALPGRTSKTMTDTIARWREFGPNVLPIPHPSWRNTGWLKRNPWFEEDVVPFLRQRVADILG
jgi:uracil-DNA glycosylase